MAEQKLYKLRLPGISFRCPTTRFEISGGEEKPLPRRLSYLIKSWIKARGLIPVVKSTKVTQMTEQEKGDLAEAAGLSVKPKPVVKSKKRVRAT